MVYIDRVKETVRTPVEKAPEPDLGGELIPKERYTSTEFMQREWERMWTKVWLIGCREEEIPEPGDYITTEVGKESLLIVRGEDGVARTFYNVCNHRGNQVKFDREGSCRTLQCAYHFWEYDLTGRLINVPDAEDFSQGCPVDRLSLKSIQTDTWGGWVWYNLNPDAEPLMDFLGVLPEHLDPYRFDEMVMVRNFTAEWDCNWKTSVDAFNEVYHVQCIHPELSYTIDDVDIQIDLYDKHNRYLVPYHTYTPRLGEELTEVPPILEAALEELHLNPDDFQGRVTDIRRAVQVEKRKMEGEWDVDYSPFNDDQLTDNYHYMAFPNNTLNIFCDRMMLFRQRPHPTDPNKMFYDVQVHARPKKGQNLPAPVHEQFKHGEQSMGLVLDQDSVNLPHVQAGMNSSAYEGLWISNQERRIRHMHKTLMDYVGED